MFIDAVSVSAGTTIEADLCIVGSGPAGLTIAREFVGTGVRVCVLESGGLETDADAQSLNEGRTSPGYPALESLQHRALGGTANLWEAPAGEAVGSARCLPYRATDFEQRAEFPLSGWPFSRADLDRHYERAQVVLGLSDSDFDAETWADQDARPLDFVGGRVTTVVGQYAPLTAITQVGRALVETASNISGSSPRSVGDLMLRCGRGGVGRVLRGRAWRGR